MLVEEVLTALTLTSLFGCRRRRRRLRASLKVVRSIRLLRFVREDENGWLCCLELR
jgi:hypothetical protein